MSFSEAGQFETQFSYLYFRKRLMRVGIIALQHESNTFIHSATTLADFEYDLLATGDAIYPIFKDSAHEIGG